MGELIFIGTLNPAIDHCRYPKTLGETKAEVERNVQDLVNVFLEETKLRDNYWFASDHIERNIIITNLPKQKSKKIHTAALRISLMEKMYKALEV